MLLKYCIFPGRRVPSIAHTYSGYGCSWKFRWKSFLILFPGIHVMRSIMFLLGSNGGTDLSLWFSNNAARGVRLENRASVVTFNNMEGKLDMWVCRCKGWLRGYSLLVSRVPSSRNESSVSVQFQNLKKLEPVSNMQELVPFFFFRCQRVLNMEMQNFLESPFSLFMKTYIE